MFSSFPARTGNHNILACSIKQTVLLLCHYVPSRAKKKREQKNHQSKIKKKNNNKKTEKVAYCLLQVRHTQVLQKEEKFKGFIHNLFI